MALGNTGRTKITAGVQHRKAFKHGHVSGLWIDSEDLPMTGDMPKVLADEFKEDLENHGKLYAVFSYRTPIAWWDGTAWHIPAVTYSITTLNHQNVVRMATK